MGIGILRSTGTGPRTPQYGPNSHLAIVGKVVTIDGPQPIGDLIAELQSIRDELRRSQQVGFEAIKIEVVKNTKNENFGKLVVTVSE